MRVTQVFPKYLEFSIAELSRVVVMFCHSDLKTFKLDISL